MKLIVDIPDEEYMSLQHHVSIGSGVNANTGECLRNYILEGEPYEEILSGDLISRDVLRAQVNKPIENAVDAFDKGYNTAIQGAVYLINSAPRVAPDYDMGYQDGLEDGLNDVRPKGEWIKMAFDDKTIVYCSECHSHYEYPFNFCPNCGAQMGGKEE